MEKVALITDGAKPVVGYEGLYVVTKNGSVFSLPRKGVDTLRAMKLNANKKIKYLRVNLCKDGKDELFYVHRVVAEAYIENPDNKPMVNHKDGNKHNNCVENLEWVTGAENQLHAFELGLYPRQKIHPSQKKDIYDLVRQGEPISKVAERYGVSYGSIYKLVRRYREALFCMAA